MQTEHGLAKSLFDLPGGQIQHSRIIPSDITDELEEGGNDFLGRDRIIRIIADALFDESLNRSRLASHLNNIRHHRKHKLVQGLLPMQVLAF